MRRCPFRPPLVVRLITTIPGGAGNSRPRLVLRIPKTGSRRGFSGIEERPQTRMPPELSTGCRARVDVETLKLRA